MAGRPWRARITAVLSGGGGPGAAAPRGGAEGVEGVMVVVPDYRGFRIEIVAQLSTPPGTRV